MPIEAHELVKGIGKLASLPEVCIRVNEMVDDPRSSAAAIGKVISRDTALTAQLLRLANSSFYNFPSNISTISRAIIIIGERELRYLVLALSAVRTFSTIPVELTNMAAFWRHAVYCAVLARLIANRCHVLHSERLFVAGLLHDIGQLIIIHREPALAREALQRARDGEALHEAEQAVLGCDHAAVGRVLLEQWKLPEVLCETVGCHHNIAAAEEGRLDAAIVHLATVIASRAELPVDHEGPLPQVEPLAWELTALDESMLEEIAAEAAPMFAESWAMIQPMVRHAK